MIHVWLRAHMLALLLSSFVVSGLAHGAAAITSVPPAENRTPLTEKKVAAPLVLPSTAPAMRIALPAPADDSRSLVKARTTNLATPQKELAKRARGRPLA